MSAAILPNCFPGQVQTLWDYKLARFHTMESGLFRPKPPYFEHFDYWAVLITIYGVIALWKSYLCLRTILRVKKMPTPPVLFDGGMDMLTFKKVKVGTESETYDKLLEVFVDFGIKVFQVTSDYYPYVWQLTADFSKSAFYRAVWFSAIDRILYESSFIPVIFINALYHRRDPFLAVLSGIYETLYAAGLSAIWAFIVVYTFELFQPSGIAFLMILYDVVGMVLLAVFMKFLENHILIPLPHNEVGTTIETVTSRTGYPINNVYVDDMSPEPEAVYYTALWFNMVTITPRLMSVLNPNEVSAVVAHELGKWYYFQNLYHHSFHFLCLIFRCYLLIATYGNRSVCNIFRVDANAHPIIPQHLAVHFFWVPSHDFARGIYNVFKAIGFLIRDAYACKVWKPSHLREALIKLSRWNLLYFPLFDGWQTSWFYGSPTSVQRISRIVRIERQSSPQLPSSEDARINDTPFGDRQ